MIAQMLDRRFILDRIEKTQRLVGDLRTEEEEELSRLLERSELDRTEWRLAVGELLASSARPEVAEDDDPVFMPRDAEASVFQSALERFYEEERPDLVEERPPGRGGRPEDALVTDRRLVGVAEPDGSQELFERFFKADVGWASVVWAKGMKLAKGKHPFNPEPAEPLAIGNRARVLLVGDWGSGIPRAAKVAREMRKVLEQGLAAGVEQHVIHLGDVYYSGFEWEYEKRFLPLWPVREGEASRITSWSLNANHDMYTGGHGYFGTLLADPRFGRQQRSSYFSLHNDHWKILGLDTGYADHDLHGPQAAWAARELGDGGRKGLLLSHHQLFDAEGDRSGAKLAARLDPLLRRGRVRSWFWGHEHECVLFAPHLGVEHARCVGHGGVPAYAKTGPRSNRVLYDYREDYLQEMIERWALFGFAVLDFRGEEIEVRYVNENGEEHHRETIA